jgi:vacuolar-type H+-ATPase subunit I/STV1
MGVKASKLIQITVPNNTQLNLLAYIQKRQVGEIIEKLERTPLAKNYLHKQEDLLENLDIVNKSLDIYKGYHTVKKSMFSAVLDDRFLITEDIFEHYNTEQGEIIKKAQEIVEKAGLKDDLTTRQEVLQDIIAKSEPLKDIELNIFKPYSYIKFLPFLVDESRAHYLVEQLEQSLSPIVLESVKKIGTDYVYILAVSKNQVKIGLDIIQNQATFIQFPAEVTGSFYDIYHKSKQEFSVNAKIINKINLELKKSPIQLKDLAILADVLNSQLNLISYLHSFNPESETNSSIKLWVDEEKFNLYKKDILDISNDIKIVELPSVSEDTPVIFKNLPIVRHFETVTKIMGYPQAGKIDPTLSIAIFFTFMFGLALSEAGYALILIILTGLGLLNSRLKSGVRDIFAVVFIASISTLIVGALFGSWFGITPDAVDPDTASPHMKFLITIGLIPFLQQLQVINPMDSVIALMGFTIVLGVIHLLFGLSLNIVQAFNQKSFWDASLDSILWALALIFGILLLLINFGLLGNGLQLLIDPLIYIYIGYVFTMIYLLGRDMKSIFAKFGKGAYDVFFGVVGYLSDILSYTRLVALGLATGIIAGVVGTLANLAGSGLVEKGGAWIVIGYIIMIVIFVAGNIFNIALNVLGTYINVGRLHFVEFFSKFFQSGGRPLQEISRSQDYSVIE